MSNEENSFRPSEEEVATVLNEKSSESSAASDPVAQRIQESRLREDQKSLLTAVVTDLATLPSNLSPDLYSHPSSRDYVIDGVAIESDDPMGWAKGINYKGGVKTVVIHFPADEQVGYPLISKFLIQKASDPAYATHLEPFTQRGQKADIAAEDIAAILPDDETLFTGIVNLYAEKYGPRFIVEVRDQGGVRGEEEAAADEVWFKALILMDSRPLISDVAQFCDALGIDKKKFLTKHKDLLMSNYPEPAVQELNEKTLQEIMGS